MHNTYASQQSMRHDMSEYECGFCDQDRFRGADVYIENGDCIFFASRDPKIRAEANLPSDVLPGSGVIIPKAALALST
jgi:hypothetical protein